MAYFQLAYKIQGHAVEKREVHADISLCAASAVVSTVSLPAELDLLLHLIALPPGTTCQRSANTPQQQQPRFISGAVAALYAAQVLSLSGRLLCFIHITLQAMGDRTHTGLIIWSQLSLIY